MQGPANSGTVRGNTLQINNVTRRYAIPRSSVLAINRFDSVGIRVRIKEEGPIWADAFACGTNLWLRPSGQALEAQAKKLSDALFTTSAPDSYRRPGRAYRCPNIIALAFPRDLRRNCSRRQIRLIARTSERSRPCRLSSRSRCRHHELPVATPHFFTLDGQRTTPSGSIRGTTEPRGALAQRTSERRPASWFVAVAPLVRGSSKQSAPPGGGSGALARQ